MKQKENWVNAFMSVIYEKNILRNIAPKFQPSLLEAEEDGKMAGFGKITMTAMKSNQGKKLSKKVEPETKGAKSEMQTTLPPNENRANNQ